ncbi:MAG: indole-3-glycerol-phosphate synthase [Deltaproteobacteria bacterium]|nr:indole-3-glycerol-phosphate synthase [Deltaproteobacteria bacterium]
MLDRFRKAKEHEIAVLEERRRNGTMPPPIPGKRPGFAAALKAAPGRAVIAEYKRASPSKGAINLEFGPEDVAAAYAKAGARAISVLTEETYFKGSLAYLEVMADAGLPLLRKDFIFNPLQVDATAATKASAVLIIVRMLDDETLAALLERCGTHGLEAVVEVFDAGDLARAQGAGASIIQVNNRDLDTLAVDLGVSHSLIDRKKAGETWISASGVFTRHDLDGLLALGFDAALVGTSLMDGPDPGANLAALLGEAYAGA